MAKKTKKNDGDTPDGPGKDAEGGDGGKKKGALLPALIVAIAVLGGGAMAGGVVGGGGGEAEAAPAPTETAPPELGMITELESLTLNLADGHFLKLGVAVEWSEEVAEEPPLAPILDLVISRYSPMTSEDLTTTTARQASKEMLLEDLTGVYGEDVVRVYFTEFVMQ